MGQRLIFCASDKKFNEFNISVLLESPCTKPFMIKIAQLSKTILPVNVIVNVFIAFGSAFFVEHLQTSCARFLVTQACLFKVSPAFVSMLRELTVWNPCLST